MPFRTAGWQLQTLLEAAQLPGKLDQHIQFKGTCLWTRIPPRVRKLYSPYKKHMSSCDDIRSVSAAFAQPMLQQAGVVRDQPLMDRQRPRHPHLLLCNCQEEAAPCWHHPTPFGIILLSRLYRVRPKEPPAFDGDCETPLRGGSAVLFSSIPFSLAKEKNMHAAGSWSDSCLGIFLIITSRAIRALKKEHLKQQLDYCTGHRWSCTVTTHF